MATSTLLSDREELDPVKSHTRAKSFRAREGVLAITGLGQRSGIPLLHNVPPSHSCVGLRYLRGKSQIRPIFRQA
jgi:hypothetical protein